MLTSLALSKLCEMIGLKPTNHYDECIEFGEYLHVHVTDQTIEIVELNEDDDFVTLGKLKTTNPTIAAKFIKNTLQNK